MTISKKEHDVTQDQRGPAVVVYGSLIGGFKLIGPFATVDDAVYWHEHRSLLGVTQLPCAVMLLTSQDSESVRNSACTSGDSE